MENAEGARTDERRGGARTLAQHAVERHARAGEGLGGDGQVQQLLPDARPARAAEHLIVWAGGGGGGTA
jgi:hypothetical protein